MSQDFIKREEFAAEVRGLRDDIKEHGAAMAKAIEASVVRLANEISENEKAWRERTHDLSDSVNLVTLRQAIQDQQLIAISQNPQLKTLHESIEKGFKGTNERLDKVNGRLDKHTSEIATSQADMTSTRAWLQATSTKVDALTGTVNQMIGGGVAPVAQPLSGKAKAATATIGGVGVLAVLHSLFEMVRAVLPEITKIFK